MTNREEKMYYINIPPKKKEEKEDEYALALKTQPWLMDDRCKESVVCTLCDSAMFIYRHMPRTNKKSYKISPRFSTYMPQKLQSCTCQEVQVLVDHKGRTRIYTNHPNKVSIKFPVLGLTDGTACRDLSLCKTIRDWVDTPYDYVPDAYKISESFDMANHLNLWPVREKNQRRFLPHPHNQPRIEFYRDYAYTFGIAVCVTISSRRIIIYPDGAVLSPTVDQGCDLIRAKSSVRERNLQVLDIYNKEYQPLRKAYRKNIPTKPLKHYPECLTCFLQYRKFSDIYRDAEGRPRATKAFTHLMNTMIKYRQDLLDLPQEGWYLRSLQHQNIHLKSPPPLPWLLRYYLRYPNKAEVYNIKTGRRVIPDIPHETSLLFTTYHV